MYEGFVRNFMTQKDYFFQALIKIIEGIRVFPACNSYFFTDFLPVSK